MHLKRESAPKKWAIERKGTTYVVRPTGNLKLGIPLLIVLRDFLGIVKNRKEAKIAISSKKILINLKKPKDEKQSLLLFDVLFIVPEKKFFRLTLNEKGKFSLEEINENESHLKISKIINKKILKGGRTQINLLDGRNFIYNKKVNVNDSVLLNLKDKKIEKILPLKEGANAFVFDGKHAGKKGRINSIDLKNKVVNLDFNGNSLKVLIKQILIIE
ncbi:MAG: 30S ribosomal protein S4e [Candidatus Pacearchaeota archaeon]|nr:MAG: 30S ribosomal protein S4e [Candidatus Pacearchaeota archaeon]